MRTAIRFGFTAALTATILIGLTGIACARDAEANGGTDREYHLRLHHLHTGEDIDVVYRIGETYLPDAIAKLDYFLRDHRTQAESHYDPKEFDVLHALMMKLGRPDGEIDIVCGYRTPWSNSLLRSRSANSGVAEHSQHMLAKAIDIRVPGVATTTLRDTALSLHAGGVGYYPVNQFVHVDVGPVREWTYGHAARRRVKTRSVARATRRPPHHAAAAVSGE
ncbi:DUF882 domain-containing protein [Edaphobacter modestus]|uniref:Murein endopeptidase K n=1 Tax=Edaphobacter modestus TaxID=388466 RepID=A0A4Q7YVW7_9BACT|nr:DUF882 domain-containing protein [Edaphobacter modestus]RZU41169.1 uncharacterized protein YcbK (DUF882 family) [Edaphobacter modestus]